MYKGEIIMSRFHINEDGNPAPCKSEKGDCPLEGRTYEENHFDSIEDAQRAADKLNESQYGILPII